MKIYNQDLKLVDQEILLDFIRSNDIIECDTETTGLDPHENRILTVQFGNRKEQYCVIWGEGVEIMCKYIMEELEKPMLFHNAKFDLKFLYKYNIYPKNVKDTFLVESILRCGYSEGGKSLKNIIKKYLAIDIDKGVRTNFVAKLNTPGFDPNTLVEDVEFIKYALDDVKYLSEVYYFQCKEIIKYDLEPAMKLDFEFVKCLAFTEWSGFKLDKQRWMDKYHGDIEKKMDLIDDLDNYILDNKVDKYINKQLDMFNEAVSTTINWASPKQVLDIFHHFKIDTLFEGKHTVGEATIKKYKNNELVKLYGEYKKTEKLTSSYGLEFTEKFLNNKTKRIHPNFRQILNTGRMSCSSPNLQQVPADEKHRNCFVPEDGNTLIVADYSGQETVVFANKCLDRNLLKFYDEGLGDMHSYVAKLCFPEELKNIGLDQVKKQRPDLRQKAKAAGFAIQYGGNGYTISNNLGLTPKEGDAIYDNYLKAFPDMAEYFEHVSTIAIRKGYVDFNEITKRKSFIHFYDDYLSHKNKMNSSSWSWDDYRKHKEGDTDYYKEVLKPIVQNFYKLESKAKRLSYNYPVQGTSSDITKIAGIYLFNYILDNNLQWNVKICNIVHDEIVVECSIQIQDKMSKVVKECMEKAGSIFCKRVPLKADPKITNVWEH